jgi:cation transport regulator ChaB
MPRARTAKPAVHRIAWAAVKRRYHKVGNLWAQID